jgi:membrane-bound lytic murein transglycosylase B
MQASQDQQGHAHPMMQQYAPMYPYAQMNYGVQPGRLPSYWGMGMGRGMPVGQHQMPGMAPNAAHSQQMLNVGKAVSGGMQGR